MADSYASVSSPWLLDAATITALFGKPRGWFSRDRVRKALYARGFPQPVIRGRWLRTAVETWLEREGNRQKHRAAPARRTPRANGYAQVG